MTTPTNTGHSVSISEDTESTSSGKYFAAQRPLFAHPRYGNKCEYYITGRDFFAAVATAFRNAEKFIFIADWQLDYDVELDQRETEGHKGRLTEILADAMARGVHVRVILYDSIRMALDTHDGPSKSALESLPTGKGSMHVMQQAPNTGESLNIFFSHHQKFIVVDGKIAFVGGMDLTYGRWETPNFDVIIDPKIHVINDAYNQQLEPGGQMEQADEMLTKPNGHRPGFCPPYGKTMSDSWHSRSGPVLDPSFQTRQPWEDVAARIEGPAAFDVFKNFVRRWNAFAGSDNHNNQYEDGLSAEWFEKIGGTQVLVDPLQKGSGTQTVQICRSVSATENAEEFFALDYAAKGLGNTAAIDTYDDWKSKNPENHKIWKNELQETGKKNTTNILEAMCNCIENAESFVYIENQFFVSKCGKDRFGTEGPASNPIAQTIARRIAKAIHQEKPFHVYLVIPEHPEGQVTAAGTIAQAYWAQQAIFQATDSLVHNIIHAANIQRGIELNLKTQGKPFASSPDPTIIAELLKSFKWTDYLTVLHMRNFGPSTRKYGEGPQYLLTEMIYVHTKLLIADDAVAILGSANINDRSLMGDGDTEIAAVIVEEAGTYRDVGQGVKVYTRKFARDFRMAIWKKHLGMMVESPSKGVEKQSTAPSGIKIEQPLAKETIEGIQSVAKANLDAYSTVFTHVLKDSTGTLQSIAELYRQGLAGPPPNLMDGYMTDGEIRSEDENGTVLVRRGKVHNVAAGLAYLKNSIIGYWTLAPSNWGSKYTSTPSPPAHLDRTIAEIETANFDSVPT